MEVKSVLSEVFACEIAALQLGMEALDQNVVELVEEVSKVSGLVVWCGIGKSGHICQKIAATMCSLGIKSVFLHPSEALHGDLGLLSENDLIICVSKSGESEELVSFLSSANKFYIKKYAVTNRKNSTLESYCDKTIVLPDVKEAFLGDLLPSSSTTLILAFGDAIAIAAAKLRGFAEKDFACNHPNGIIGKRLTLTAGLLMRKNEENVTIESGATLKEAILKMCETPIGCVNIVDSQGVLQGLLTDGDLRRLMLNANISDMMSMQIENFMVKEPKVGTAELLVVNALKIMVKPAGTISVLPIVDSENKLQGTLCLKDISKVGLI